jgi:hypothetical protein
MTLPNRANSDQKKHLETFDDGFKEAFYRTLVRFPDALHSLPLLCYLMWTEEQGIVLPPNFVAIAYSPADISRLLHFMERAPGLFKIRLDDMREKLSTRERLTRKR